VEKATATGIHSAGGVINNPIVFIIIMGVIKDADSNLLWRMAVALV
jgi:hypothetical protein